MNENTSYYEWNLKEIARSIIEENDNVTEIYLFGSRAYNTGSLRSDIDILIVAEAEVPDVLFRDRINNKYPPVDLFITVNNLNARSLMNGSVLNKREKYSTIIEQIDAVLLWKKDDGFSNEFTRWKQLTQKNIDFKMSILPSYPTPDIKKTVNDVMRKLNDSNIESFFTGTDCTEIAHTVIDLMKITFVKPTKYSPNAKNFSYDSIKIESEYDFQNLIHMILRPIFRSIEPEPVEIIMDGNKKIADFAFSSNKIVIEAKYIDSNSKKIDVLKTLDGLSRFYSENPNVKALIFLILYEGEKVELDPVALKSRYTDAYGEIPVFTEFINNTF